DIDRILRQELGHDFPIQEWFAHADRHYKRMTLEEPLPLKSGVHDLLDLLGDASIPAIVATSTTTDLARLKLNRVDILHYFVDVVGGDQVAHGKPAPDIYLRAAEVLQLAPET
ncbi:HAD family hydrolase, partial [Arthrospira platensis SPKY1]|nr:HAD family hydrolase [Arthrospira platensis SPKY1]